MSDGKMVNDVQQVMQSVVARTCHYFEREYGISLDKVDAASLDQPSLTLLDMTAIVGMGSRLNLLITFSFDDDLINVLYQRMTADFEARPDEVALLREAAAGELANTIVGHCTVDLQYLDRQCIALTPPTIVNQAKTIRRMTDSIFYTQKLNTAFGHMNISLLGPREMFDTNLEYVK